jgi:hypothetical protein
MDLVHRYILRVGKELLQMLLILYFYLIDFFKKRKPETLADGVADGLNPLVYSRELEKNYYKYHCHYLLTNKITYGLCDDYISNSLKEIRMDKK